MFDSSISDAGCLIDQLSAGLGQAVQTIRIGIFATIHGDEPEVLGVDGQRVYRRVRPHLHGRVHGTRGDQQQRKPSSMLLVVDRRLSVIESRHLQNLPNWP